MTRSLLLLAALALPAEAAPQLKPRGPAPGTEGARIEALRAKYDGIRKSGDLGQRMRLADDEEAVRGLIRLLDDVSGGRREVADAIVKNVGVAPRTKDLYDIAMSDRDRKTAGGGK